MQEVVVPTLQVRDLPEDIYISLTMLADKENRSIAQQAITLLKEGLGLHANNQLRRKALIQKFAKKTYPKSNKIDTVALVSEDRER